MITSQNYNKLRVALKHSALAFAVAAGLGAGSAQALTTTQTFDLGTSPTKTTIQPGVGGLLPWIAKGTLPAGSILRSVSVNAKIEDVGSDATTDDYASDICIYLDSTPAAPGTAAILQVGGFETIGTVSLALTDTTSTGWANGQNGPPATVVDTKLEAAWSAIGAVDLNTVELSVGNDYSEASWSGTITVEYDVFEPAKITTFGPGAVVSPLVGNAANITWTVPYGTNVTTLAPTFTLSSGTCDKTSGGTYDFTSPVIYTVTDGASVNTFTVTVTSANAVAWNVAGSGDWDTSTANWLPLPSGSPTTFTNGNEVLFDNTAGGTIAIAADMSPASTTVSATSGTYVFIGGPIATGPLTKNGAGDLQILGVASIPPSGGATPLSHTYDGGTVINGGRLILGGIVNGLSPEVVNPVGSGPVTLNAGTIEFQRVTANNALTVGDGTTLYQNNGWGATWSGPVTLNGTTSINTIFGLNFSGNVTGPGGFTKTGTSALTFSGTNDYSGPMNVTAGTLRCNNADALGSGDLSISSGGAKVDLNYTGNTTIASLTLGGALQANGIYGSLTSGAIIKSVYFEGSGTVTVGDPATFAFITSFGTNVAASTAVIDPVSANAAAISWIVPSGTDLATLAPDFVLSPGATCSDQTSTTVPSPGFDAGPVVYTVVSQDSSVTNVYTVSVTVIAAESTLIWNLGASGDWNYSTANWLGQTSGLPTVFVDDVNVIFSNTAGGTVTVPTSVTVTPGNMTVNAASGTYRWAGNAGNIGGTGSLTKSGAGILKIGNSKTASPTEPMLNTFSGGTIIDGGELWLEPTSHTGLGSGSVTLNAGILRLYRINAANALIVNGGKLYTQNGFGNNWNGPVTLNTTLPIEPFHGLTIGGIVSGVGGLTVQTNTNTVTLTAANTYTGPTSVTAGVLKCNSPNSLGGGALSITGGKLNLSFTGTKTVSSMTLGGIAQTTPGTYGSVASGANFQSDTYFTSGSPGTVTISVSQPLCHLVRRCGL